jgi:hypothetical protein
VVEIPLGNGQATLARDLGTEVEFYDRLIAEGEDVDVTQVRLAPIAFQVPVMDSAFKRGGGWRVIGQLPLGNDEPRDARFFKQDPISGRLSIYWEDHLHGGWHEVPATVEECSGLEQAAVWSAIHIEDRLRDHFAGRASKWVEALDASRVPVGD